MPSNLQPEQSLECKIPSEFILSTDWVGENDDNDDDQG